MKNSIFQNTCRPEGLGGKLTVAMMNLGHAKLSKWGFQYVEIEPNAHILDVGCGGGANVTRLLKRCPQGKVTGIDYSDISVETSQKKNQAAIDNGRCEILRGDVSSLPFNDEVFHAVTAFETIYFWPDLANSFTQVFWVLRPDGVFLICNESDGENKADEKWTKTIIGMHIYNKEELEHILRSVGFREIIVHHDQEKHWLCVTAKK